MHTITELSSTVPAFLAKLWKLVSDPENNDLICWAPNGRSFFIKNQARFARELLPHYYKHNNMASFIRQLNMYGFHKKVSVEIGGLKCDKDEMEFAHQYFCRGHPYLVEHIKRKIASNKGQDTSPAPMKPELMNKMLTEVRSMRGRQETLDSRLGSMKRENEALWRELAMLRQKHLKQQQIVNKLIHFLVTLVQPARNSGLPVKRRYPLMINDSHRPRKQSKISKPTPSPTGPVIHEVDSDPDLDPQYIVAEMLENHCDPSIQSPDHEPSDEESRDEFRFSEHTAKHLKEEIQELDQKNKRAYQKGKKKRKNKVPIKILIPAMDNDEESREETHLLDMPTDRDEPITIDLLKNDISKPVPTATTRSSKLAAMAANMNKNNQQEEGMDFENFVGLESETEEDDNEELQTEPNDDQSLIKFEDILIIPEMVNEDDTEQHTTENHKLDNANVEKIVKAESIKLPNDNAPTRLGKKSEKEKSIKGSASTSSSLKDLTLSRVISSGSSETVDRLGSTECMDDHLETMQTELENLREILRGEGYVLDANTLLGLFGNDDPMSFGIPVNPELDPRSSSNDKDDDSQYAVTESVNGTGVDGGEIMTYNSTPDLLDFEDMFLDVVPSSSSLSPPSTTNTTNYLVNDGLDSSDPFDLDDRKSSLLGSLV